MGGEQAAARSSTVPNRDKIQSVASHTRLTGVEEELRVVLVCIVERGVQVRCVRGGEGSKGCHGALGG